MRTALRKVWRDLWNNKGRTLLVVLSIGVGVLALGMITASNNLLTRQMTRSQQASQPSNLILYLNGRIDDEVVKIIARLPEVAEAQGAGSLGLRWKPTLDAEWQNANLTALDDYTQQLFDLVELRTGSWPRSGTASVEFNHQEPFGVPAEGATIYFEVNNRPRPITLAGTVRDPWQSPPPFSDTPNFYVTRETLAVLGGSRDYDTLKLSLPVYSDELADEAAEVVKTRLEKLGVGVGFVQKQAPDRHFLQDLLDGIGLVLAVMAALSLGLSTILVVNTINAVIAQQVPQIGIMKTVGGLSPQIASLYLAGIAIYGLLSLAVAVPLGALGADAMLRWMLALINVPAAPFEVLQRALMYQLGAGLLTPLLAGFFPVAQGVSISVREALNAYGLGSGRYGQRLIDRIIARLPVRFLPRMLTLALRNTFRRPGRVALTEITLIAAGAIFMMVVSTHHSFNSTIEQIFRGFGFDVMIGFEQFQRIDEVIPQIEARPNVALAEMWVFSSGKARVPGAEGPGSEYDVFLRGVPTDTVLFTPELTAGRNLDPADGRAILLNQKLARAMGVGVGEQIILDLGDAGEAPWTVVGLIFDLGGRDQDTAYVHLHTFNRELNLVGRASVAQISSVVQTLEAQTAMERDLREYFEGEGIGLSFTDTAIRNREQANAQFSILTTLLLIMTCLIAIVGSFGLSGTLSINVLERRREIGVMRAVGAGSADVGFIFVGEGLLLGVLSWAQAVPLSLLAGRYFVEALGEVIDFPVAYSYSTTGVWIWLAIVVVLSLAASWFPARRATHISVRESLAYE